MHHMAATLWTIQDFVRVASLEAEGVIHGSSEKVRFPESYIWMVEQLRLRLPGFSGHYPIWAWTEKPDLRLERHAYKQGEWACRICFEVPESRVLRSDFETWHLVLNNYIIASKEETDKWEHQGGDPAWMRKSWERVFDLDYWRTDPEWFGVGPPAVQVCVDGLHKAEVRSIEWFRGSKCPSGE